MTTPCDRCFDYLTQVRALADIIRHKDDSLDGLLQAVVDWIPQCLDHSEEAAARLILGRRVFESCHFDDFHSRIERPVQVRSDDYGWLQVGYLALPFGANEPVFFEQEKQLVAIVAERLGRMIQRKQTEEALRESEYKFRTVTDHLQDWESWFDEEAQPAWVSPSVQRLIGYSAEECLGMADFPRALVHPDDVHTYDAEFGKAMRGEPSSDLVFRFSRRDGTILWGATTWKSLWERDGRLAGYRLTIRDVTVLAKPFEAQDFVPPQSESRLGHMRGKNHSSGHDTACLLPRLSRRQREVLGFVLAGYPNKAIAAQLGIAERTVEDHRAKIMAAFRVNSLPELTRVVLAEQAGLKLGREIT